MKHVILFLCKLHKSWCLLLFVIVLSATWWAIPVAAQTFTVDSLTYEISAYLELVENETGMVPVEKKCVVVKEAHPDLVHAVIPEMVSYEGTSYPVRSLNSINGYTNSSPFYNHTALRTVIFPAGENFILNGYAFNGCTNLHTVTFDPESRISVGGHVFYGCTSLTSLDFPVHTSFGSASDYFTGGRILEGSGVKHIRISGDFWPSDLSDRSDSYWGEFANSPELESVELCEGVTTLPSNCFANCPKLTSVTLPESLVRVDHGAYGNPNHASTTGPFLLNQPDGLIYLGKTAYAYKGEVAPGTVIDIRSGTRIISYELLYREADLTEATIRIPKSVERIEGRITANMEFEEGNPVYPYTGGILYGNGGTTLIKAFNMTESDFTVPSTVSSIYGGAFEKCSTLRSLTIPATVKGIVKSILLRGSDWTPLGGVVQGCEALEHLTLQSGAALQSNGMFTDCPALKEVIVDCNYVQDSLFNELSNASDNVQPFNNCPAIETLTFTDRVDYIAPLFSRIDTLNVLQLNLPERVKWIGNETFYNFARLKQVIIPQTEVACGHSIFAGCTDLEQADIHRMTNSIPDRMFKDCINLSSVELPAGITQLGDSAFLSCTNLQTINLDNIVSMGSMCFMGCTALSDVQAPAIQYVGCHPFEETGYSRTGGVYYLGDKACGYDVSLPDSVPVSIDIREGTTEILPFAFSNQCDLNTSISLSTRSNKVLQFPIRIADSVRNIGAGAFKTTTKTLSARNMAEFFNLPANVEYIGDEAFVSFGLTDTLFILPASVKSIGNKAFYFRQRNPLSFYVQTAEPCDIYVESGLNNSFQLSPTTQRNRILYVPVGCKEVYAESPWGQLFSNIREYDKLSTAIHTPTTDTKIAVRLTTEGICVNEAARVYTFDGLLVAETREATTLRLPKGQSYIVVCGRTSIKVYVP